MHRKIGEILLGQDLLTTDQIERVLKDIYIEISV